MSKFSYGKAEIVESLGFPDIAEMMQNHVDLYLVFCQLHEMVNHRNDMRADADALINQTLKQYFSHDSDTGGKK